jgi:hydrogenase expression/formation protein HypE
MTKRSLPPGKLAVALLRELLALAPAPGPEVRLPPTVGEDAGVVDVPSGALIVATDPITLTGYDIGAHAVVVNANDVAVMGARPRWFLVAVLLPSGTTEEDVRALFKGLYAALERIGAALVGGHTEITTVVRQPVVIGQMLGLREDGQFIRTGGVREGDVILQVGRAPIEGAAVLANEAQPRLSAVTPEILAATRPRAVCRPASMSLPRHRLSGCASMPRRYYGSRPESPSARPWALIPGVCWRRAHYWPHFPNAWPTKPAPP